MLLRIMSKLANYLLEVGFDIHFVQHLRS